MIAPNYAQGCVYPSVLLHAQVVQVVQVAPHAQVVQDVEEFVRTLALEGVPIIVRDVPVPVVRVVLVGVSEPVRELVDGVHHAQDAGDVTIAPEDVEQGALTGARPPPIQWGLRIVAAEVVEAAC